MSAVVQIIGIICITIIALALIGSKGNNKEEQEEDK